MKYAQKVLILGAALLLMPLISVHLLYAQDGQQESHAHADTSGRHAAGHGKLHGEMTHAPGTRQGEVERRGRAVMPFDLDRTVHVFENLEDGGRQTVVAKDSNDVVQIELIRAHLREEAARFTVGDYGDPAQIHGADMPGLEALSKGADRVDVTYEDVQSGGRILYTSSDPAMVGALHRWFEAQRGDHGRHARSH